MSSGTTQTLKNPPAGVKHASNASWVKDTIWQVESVIRRGRLADVVVLSVRGLLSGNFTLRLRCGTRLGVGHGLHDTLARRPGMRELGTEEDNERRIIDPDQQRDQRPRCTVGRANAGAAYVV